ncbi:hypothetical protein EJB05_38276, partial [Eragrostis curvula]
MAKRKEIHDAVTVTTKTVDDASGMAAATINDATGMGKRIDDPATEATTAVHRPAGLAAAIVDDAAGNGKRIHVDDPTTEEATTTVHPAGLAAAIVGDAAKRMHVDDPATEAATTTTVHPAGLAAAIVGEAAGNKASTCESAATVDDSAAAATVDEAMATTEHVVHFNNTKIRTMVTKDYKAVADFIQEVRGDHREHLVVGLDTEWRDQYIHSEWRTRKRTALIQLCVGTRCLVYQIYQAKNEYPKILKEFLECPHCKFIGADVENDTTRLANDFGIYVRNAVEYRDREREKGPDDNDPVLMKRRSDNLQRVTRTISFIRCYEPAYTDFGIGGPVSGERPCNGIVQFWREGEWSVSADLIVNTENREETLDEGVYQQTPLSAITADGNGVESFAEHNLSVVNDIETPEEMRKAKNRIRMQEYRKRKREEREKAAEVSADPADDTIDEQIDADDDRAYSACWVKKAVYMKEYRKKQKAEAAARACAARHTAAEENRRAELDAKAGDACDDHVGHHNNWEPDETDRTNFGEEDLDAADLSTQCDLPVEEEDDETRLYGLRDVKYKSYRVDTGKSSNGIDPYDHVYSNLPKKHHVLKRAKDCIHCGAKRIYGKGKAFCCRSGMVKIHTPEVSAEFRSMGAKVDRRVATAVGTGVYTFRIQGQVYHMLDQLSHGKYGPRHMQLYFYDTDFSIEHRAKASPHLDEGLIRNILQLLENNPYTRTFRMLGGVPNLEEYRIELNTEIDVDQRRYNAPTVSQVTAIFMPGTDPQHVFERSVMVCGLVDKSVYIRAYHGCYDPLSYPLFFPGGEAVWNKGIQYVEKKKDDKGNKGRREWDHYRELNDELSLPAEKEDLKIVHTLNPEQRAAFDEIMDHVKSGKGQVFFVDGPGGTGKTYLYKALIATVREMCLIAVAIATSVAVTKRQTVETLDRSLQDIMGCSQPFGGKVMVFGEDFRQVLPVVPRGTRAQITDACLLRSYIWEKTRKIKLTRNMRAQKDLWFSEYLLRIGNGTEKVVVDDYVQIPDDVIIDYSEDGIDNLINNVFKGLMDNVSCAVYMSERAILSTKNEHVDALNSKMIDMFPGESRTYYSFDSVDDDKINSYPLDFLNSLTPNGLPPHELKIKVNCPLILLRNLDPHNGLCNGTRLVVRALQDNAIDAEIVGGAHAGKRVFIPRIPLSPSEDLSLPFKFKRKQFPGRLSFAMTINKAQGQTIPIVGVFLPESVFSHGQLYVALSRGVSRDTTWVLAKPNKLLDPTGKSTKNIVYRDVLESC